MQISKETGMVSSKSIDMKIKKNGYENDIRAGLRQKREKTFNFL